MIHQNAFDEKGRWSITFIVVRSYFRNSSYEKWLGGCPIKPRVICLCLHTWLWQGLCSLTEHHGTDRSIILESKLILQQGVIR